MRKKSINETEVLCFCAKILSTVSRNVLLRTSVTSVIYCVFRSSHYLLEDLVSFTVWRRDMKYHECYNNSPYSNANPTLYQKLYMPTPVR